MDKVARPSGDYQPHIACRHADGCSGGGRNKTTAGAAADTRRLTCSERGVGHMRCVHCSICTASMHPFCACGSGCPQLSEPPAALEGMHALPPPCSRHHEPGKYQTSPCSRQPPLNFTWTEGSGLPTAWMDPTP